MLNSTNNSLLSKSSPPPEVNVPTATAIVFDRDNPFLILVGWSRKHHGFVLPGGKLDQDDVVGTSMAVCAETCIRRELREEIGVQEGTIQFWQSREDRNADVRTVSVENLSGSLAATSLSKLSRDSYVTAYYGVPDFVFKVGINQSDAKPSDELQKLSWIDCRDYDVDAIRAGHHALIYRYRASLGTHGKNLCYYENGS
jgi:8-oxo-dGTP pyrophosphatase MutT (NUDIX family)